MRASNLKKRRGQLGQAAIEAALSLPFLVWLIYYTLNAFHTLHTSHVGQKYAAMNLYQRIDNRSKFIVDSLEGGDGQVVANRSYFAVQYTEPGDGNSPKRRILLDPTPTTEILNVVGICREPGCN